jgi:hypothetical protein
MPSVCWRTYHIEQRFPACGPRRIIILRMFLGVLENFRIYGIIDKCVILAGISGRLDV